MTKDEITSKLDSLIELAIENKNVKLIVDVEIIKRIKIIARSSNKSGNRLLLSSLLAKIVNEKVDIRKPYTEIDGDDSFSGRTYDEKYLTSFISKYHLPLNRTTGYLTPAFRNINSALTLQVEMVGRPKNMYVSFLQLLDDVQSGKVTANILFVEMLKELLLIKEENETRMESLLENLKHTGDIPLSSEQIVTILEQHLKSGNASRLPVLMVAAAYNCANEYLKEKIVPLQSHNAADMQTGSLGDVEITLSDDDKVVTSYEMKLKRVTEDDIRAALVKIENTRIDNYIFITTEPIDKALEEYASSLYIETGGIEFTVLDCLSFIRHFLHLFHRIRIKYLEEYQSLVLNEPISAVAQTLKEVLLTIRQQAESSNNSPNEDIIDNSDQD
jgi:hypothetical protein